MKLYGMLLALLFNAHVLLAAEVTVTVSSKERDIRTFDGGKVFDGQMDSRWSSEFADKQFLKIVLPKALPIKTIEVIWENSYAKHYKVKISEDKKGWNLIYNEKNKENNSSDLIQVKKDKNTRYINLEFIKRATSYGFSIYEIKLNGKILKNFLKDHGIEDYELISIVEGKDQKSKQETQKETKPKSPSPKKESAPIKINKEDKLIYI